MNKAKAFSFICAITLILAACSGGGGSSSGTVISGGGGGGSNSAPVITSTAPTNAVEATLYTYQASASDADGDILSWALITFPSGMTVNGSGLVQWTPSAAQVGSHNVRLDVSDGMVSASQNWTITVSAAGSGNQPPVITSTAPTTATEGQQYTYQAAASDPNGDPLTWSLTTSPSGMSVGASTGLVTWTPSAAQVGSHSVTLEVSDGQVSAQQSWTITVSPASTGGGNGTATGGSGGGTGTVNGSYQGRNYRLHVPTSYSQSTPSPLVIALHGLGDTYTNFHNTLAGSGWTSAANSNNFILMTPQHMNSSRASFLHLSGSSLDQQGTQNEIAGVILAAYYGVGATHNIETEKIYFIGFSEGAVVVDLTGFWFNKEIRAIAPYAGGITGKPMPVTRDIPVYAICGTQDSGYSGVQTSYAEWVNAGHTTNNAWVSGVGHSFSGLCTSGPTPSSVYQWLSAASFSTPVTSAWQSQGGGSTGGNPSNGSGGAAPGNQTRSVTVSGLGTHDYYLYIPSSYSPGTAMPVLFGFHGAGGTGTAPAAAQQVRNDWATVAATEGFIVIAQAATGSGGGWVPNNDAAILNAIISDAFGAYNIEQNRIYMWGFSAGGHFAHALALNNPNYFAGYGVSAGALQALAGTSAPADSLVSPISTTGRRIPVHLYVGSTDSVVPPSVVQSDRNNFQSNGWALGTNLWYTEFSGGHTYATSHLSAIWNNIKNHTLP
jgi:poly(3-hydroxybutyrate) depolymerase